MNRRRFLHHTGRALAASPIYSLASGFLHATGAEEATQSIPPAILKRIGVTTVCFRERFPATRSRGAAAPPGGDLTLLTAPKFIADNLGLHNVEVWNAQFADTSLDYCKQLKAAAEAVGSRIINIQLDLGQDDKLSDPDPAIRAASLQKIKEWMDRAQACGASSMRANTGGGSEANWDVNRTADSFRQLAQHGKPKGVMILIENHVGYSANIDKVVELVKAVNDPNCRVICDWGNTPANGTPNEKVAALSKLFPYLHLVSAKELDFDDQNQHVSYDIVPIIKATEASGFRGVYSIEFYSNKPPRDVVGAVKDVVNKLAANIKA